MATALLAIRSLQLLGLFSAMVLVAVGHGLCAAKETGRALRQCTSDRISMDMWPQGHGLLNVQFGVVAMSILACFVTIFPLASAAGCSKKEEDTAPWLPLGISVLSLVLAAVEAWMAIRGYDYAAISKPTETKIQDVAYVESWVAATMIYLVVAVLYLSDWCVFAPRKRGSSKYEAEQRRRPDSGSEPPEIMIPHAKADEQTKNIEFKNVKGLALPKKAIELKDSTVKSGKPMPLKGPDVKAKSAPKAIGEKTAIGKTSGTGERKNSGSGSLASEREKSGKKK